VVNDDARIVDLGRDGSTVAGRQSFPAGYFFHLPGNEPAIQIHPVPFQFWPDANRREPVRDIFHTHDETVVAASGRPVLDGDDAAIHTRRLGPSAAASPADTVALSGRERPAATPGILARARVQARVRAESKPESKPSPGRPGVCLPSQGVYGTAPSAVPGPRRRAIHGKRPLPHRHWLGPTAASTRYIEYVRNWE